MGNKPIAPSALEKFIAEQAGLLRKIVNDVVERAVEGAISEDEGLDEFEFYHEINYDDIERMLEPLTKLGVTLSYERLSEFLDDHPHVNYTDPHNTGITVYLKDQAIQRTPKGEPQKAGQKGTLAELLASGIPLKKVELCGKKHDPANGIVVQRLDRQIMDQFAPSEWGDVLRAPVTEIYPHHDYMVAVLECDPRRVTAFAELAEGIAEEEAYERTARPNAGLQSPAL